MDDPVSNEGDLHAALGKKIRELRQSSGLTQAELANRLAISRTSLTNMELGRQRLLVDQLYKMADILNARPHDLLPQASEIIGASAGSVSQPSIPKSVHRFVEKMSAGKAK